MGQIVGAAVVSHHPGLVQPKEIRVQRGNGRDSDLIEGFDRVRAKVDALKPDTLRDLRHALAHDLDASRGRRRALQGHVHVRRAALFDVGLPLRLSRRARTGGAGRGGRAGEEGAGAQCHRAELPLHYPTINVVHLLGRGEKVLSVGTCQTAKFKHFLQMGEVVAEAVRRSDARVVLLASGAMSHKFYDLDHMPPNPRVWHPDNVSDPKNRALDMEVLGLWKEGRHDIVLDRFPELEAAKYEGHGAHYAQMMGALGARSCRAKGTQLSEYENAAGTGNVHVWFDL